MKSRITDEHWVLSKPIAHRGLWNESFPENTLSAYKNAIDNGYPIEMDIQMSKDGKLFCFHDDNAKRMTGVDKDIRTLSANEIENLTVGNEKIPTFEEFLDLVDGKVPLLIEIKQQINKGIEEKTVAALKDYKGEYVIQSFDPFVMLKIKKLTPNVIRGQLGCNNDKKGLKWRVVRNLSLNFLVKPDFVHYCVNDLPVKNNVTNKLPLICWTVRNEDDLTKAKKYAKNFVFEILPP